MTRPSAQYVKAMFEKGAPFYDSTNTVLSLGIDDSWRRDIARAITAPEGGVVADVARQSIDSALILSVAHAEFEQALEGYGQAIHEVSNGNVTALDALTDLQRRVEAR